MPMTVLAHISDLHIGQRPENASRAAAVMDYLNGLPGRVDAIVVTGDIADHGAADEYAEAADILRSPYPVLVCPGNHDQRKTFRSRLLGEGEADEPINRIAELPGAIIALCDSSVPGRNDGLLSAGTIAWLRRAIADAGEGRPILIAFHHPPVEVGSPFLDSIRQFGEDRLAAVIADHPAVAGVLCGHGHSSAAATFAGVPLRMAPGVASTLKLPWEHDGVLDFRLPPGIAFHIIDERGILTSHYRLVPV